LKGRGLFKFLGVKKMNPLRKCVLAINQLSTTNGATTAGIIDTLGYDFAEIDVVATSSNDTTNNPSVLKLSESDDLTAYSDVSGAVGDTDFTIPAVYTNTASDFKVKFSVDCRPRKRYLKVSVSPVTTQIFTAIASLHLGDEGPTSATDASVDALVEI
jgi:hypothetical protein